MAAVAGRLQNLVESAVEAVGYELVGVEYLPQGAHSLLRVYIDQPEGITVEDCERASRQISAVLEVEDPIPGQYTLEVSSPGLDRPLFTEAHYERFVGSTVQLRLAAPVEGRRKFKGVLKGVEQAQVVVEVEGEELRFPLETIERGRLVPEW